MAAILITQCKFLDLTCWLLQRRPMAKSNRSYCTIKCNLLQTRVAKGFLQLLCTLLNKLIIPVTYHKGGPDIGLDLRTPLAYKINSLHSKSQLRLLATMNFNSTHCPANKASWKQSMWVCNSSGSVTLQPWSHILSNGYCLNVCMYVRACWKTTRKVKEWVSK